MWKNGVKLRRKGRDTHQRAYQCASLTVHEVNHFHKMFFNSHRKIVQDHIILKYCSVSRPKRNRQKKEGSSRKGMVIKYFIKKATLAKGRPNKVPVCQKTFMNIIKVSKSRIQNICKKHWIKGEPLKKNRGGDTRSRHSVDKCNAVDTFMTSLRTPETHYCRGKSKDSIYQAIYPLTNSGECTIAIVKIQN
ncbi:hypothetical protein J6590_102621 [Homalodisca vitripennis]|nr:hypothetical protein J6590_102621 [Homalodisca vitripennis]